VKRTSEKTAPDVPDQLFFAFTAEPASTAHAQPADKTVATPAPRAEQPFRTAEAAAPVQPVLIHETVETGLSFITESRVAEIFLDVAAQRRPGQIKAARVAFYPFRATLYSFKITKQGIAKVKFHQAFRGATENVFSQASHLMLIRRAADRRAFHRTDYDQFVRAMPSSAFEMPGARKTRRVSLAVPGVYRSLEESFARVNHEYFQSQLEQPELCWSPVRARRILGSYQERSDRLIISQVFDSPKVPIFVLDYLMYHELLHKFLGIGRRNDGKRCMHGKDFRELEQKFVRFDEAQAFLKKL
jgi:hypothetical protein